MQKFWTYYDNLATTNPLGRFGMFMILAVLCQVAIPVGLKYGANVDMGLGQVIGIIVMAAVAWVRHLSMGNKKHRTLLICISIATIAALMAALYLAKAGGVQ